MTATIDAASTWPPSAPSRSARAALDVLGACAVGCAFFAPIGKAPFNLFFWVSVLAFAVVAVRLPGTLRATLRDPVVRGAIALFALYAASLAWTEAPRGAGLAQLGSYRVLLMPLLLAPALADPRWRDRAFAALIASLIVVLVLGWITWLHPLPFARSTIEFGRPGVPLRDVYVFSDRIRQNIHLSMLLAWAGGTALLVGSLSPRLRAGAALLALACVVQMLWLLHGRTGWVVTGALATWLLHARFGARGLVAGLAVVVAVAVAALLGSPAVGARLAGTLAEARAWIDAGVDNATGLRMEMWSNSLRMIADAPLLGHGIESYQTISAAMYAAIGRVPLEVYHDPHQEFLYVAVELGLAGLALLVAGLVGLWRLAERFDDRWRWLTRAAVVAYASAGMVNCLLNLGWTGYYFGALLAMIAGRHLQQSRGAGSMRA